ncbi:MAG: PPC domain-containing protein, partial [Planctomycetota bacterium]
MSDDLHHKSKTPTMFAASLAVIALALFLSAETVRGDEELPPPRDLTAAGLGPTELEDLDERELDDGGDDFIPVFLTAGPDDFGYTSIDSTEPGGPAYSFGDISAVGGLVTFTPNYNDGGSAPKPIGFAFPFYDMEHTQVVMSTNGYLTFDLGGDLTDPDNKCPLPNVDLPDRAIYVLWDDLILTPNGAAYYAPYSPCPATEGGTGDCVIFQWENARRSATPEEFDFEVILYDNGNILMNFDSGNPDHGSSSTTGIERACAGGGFAHACNTPGSIPDNYSVLFTYPRFLDAQVDEIEPNFNPSDATPLNPGECAVGMINPVGDRDYWIESGAQPGDLIFAYVDTQRSSTGHDSFLRICRDGCSIGIEDDDSDGRNFGSVVAGAIAPAAGDTFYLISKDGDNQTIIPYEFFHAIVDSADTAAEIEGNDTAATATPITASVMTGDVVGPDMDFFSFTANAGDSIVVIMDDNPDDDGFLVDTGLKIMNTDGTTVLPGGDGNDESGRDGSAAGRCVAPTTGTYYVRVVDGGLAPDTDYQFVVIVNCEVFCFDSDGDGACDAVDPCPDDNPNDSDGDGHCDSTDICPGFDDDDDLDGDGVPDGCDPCPADDPDDSDGDGVCDSLDICPGSDDLADLDTDLVPDGCDNCPSDFNTLQEDGDGNGVGDACEP